MRRFHRILAMILAIVTALTVVPMSVFADTWLEAETEKEMEGDVSSTNITLSVDPEALITYLKNGDRAGLVEGISLDGLRDAFDKDELMELISEAEIKNIADIALAEVDLEFLMQYIDVDALIESIDMDALVAQIRALPDLQDYVLDYDKLMSYLDEDDLLGAIDYVDTEALIEAHVDELVDLTLDLDANTIADLVDVKKVVELDGIDFAEVLNMYFIENNIGYDNLYLNYVDQGTMLDYLHNRFDNLKHELHYYIKEDGLEKFLAVHAADLIPYLDFARLQDMIAEKITDYSSIKPFLNKTALYDLVRGMEYSSLDPYVNEELAKKLVIENDLIDPEAMLPYIDVGSSAIDMDALMNSDLITDDVIEALFDGGAIDVEGNVDTAHAKKIIVEQDLIDAEELLEFIDLENTKIDLESLMDSDLITDDVITALFDGGAIDVEGNVDTALAKTIIIEQDLIDAEALLPYIDLHSTQIDVDALIDSDLITDDVIDALFDGGAIDLGDNVDAALAKEIIVEQDLIDAEALLPYIDLHSTRIDVDALMDSDLITDEIRTVLRNGGAIDSLGNVDNDKAKKIILDGELIAPKELIPYFALEDSAIDIAGVMGSDLITSDICHALLDGGAIALENCVDLDKAKQLILDEELIASKELIPYFTLEDSAIDMAGVIGSDLITADVCRALVDGGAIDLEDCVDFDKAKQIILDNEQLIAPKDLIPYFELGDSAIDMAGVMGSDLITADVCRALIDGGAIALENCVDFEKAKQIILDKDLIDLEALLDYVDLDTCVLDTAGLIADTELMTDAVYDALIEGGAVDAKGMLTAENPLFDLNTLHEKGAVNITKIVTGEDRLFTVAELEAAEVIDYEKVLVGDAEAGLSGLNPEWLLNEEYAVFDLREMLSTTTEHNALFTIEELAAEGVILLDEMVSAYGYDNLVDVDALKTQIMALKDKGALIDCIVDPKQVIRVVGITNALEATGESYSTLIEKYVADQEAFFNALGVTNLLSEISANGELEEIFDLDALIDAIGFDTLLELVDIQTVLNQLVESGALQQIIKDLDPDTYTSVLTYAMGVLEKNIYEIKINDTVITEKNGTLLFIDTAVLVDTVLDELLPEIDDIVNMEDDGLVFSASLSITYASEDTDGVKKTKNIGIDAVLASGVERVRAAATRAKNLMERFLVYEFNDGILTLDLRLPGKFATALRIALEALSTKGDPELEALKNEILDLYDASINDVSAFIDALTLEQVVALLNAIDASKFSNAYSKVMTAQYVEILLSYVENATGEDFTDLTPEDLLIKAGELPTLESLCDKIEEKIGRKIDAFDRLPAGDPAEILERLAARAGVEVDVKKLLEDAAKTEDPLATLYKEAIARIEVSGDAYELINGRVVNVLDRLLSSRFGEKLSVLHLDDLYDGEGVFKYSKNVLIDPMIYVRRLAEKGVSLLGEKTNLPADTVERVVELFMSYFKEGTELTFGVDATLRADLYKIEFFEMVGTQLLPVRTAFLPVGADLAAIQPYETDSLHRFVGWKDPVTNEIYATMPAKDVQVVAEFDDNLYHVYFYAWDTGSLLEDALVITAGETLEGYFSQMNAIVRKYLNQDLSDERIEWRNYPDQTKFEDWQTPIIGDKTLTWMHFYDVEIVNPADGSVKETLTVPAGTVLAAVTLNDIVRGALEKEIPDSNIKWLITGTDTEYAFDSAVKENFSLTWSVSYQVKIVNPSNGEEIYTLTVPYGDALADHIGTMNGLVRDKLGLDDVQLPDANIEWYDWADENKTSFDTAKMEESVTADASISWKHYFTVTVQKPNADEVVDTVRVPGGDKLNVHLSALNAIVKDALKDTHPNLADANIVWFDTEGQKLDLATVTVNAPLFVTWELGFTVKLFHGTATEPFKTLQLVGGESLADYLDEMNAALKEALDNDFITEIRWYNRNAPETMLDEDALEKEVVSDLELFCNCYFTVTVNGQNGEPMTGYPIYVPYGSAMSQTQIEKIKSDVLSYIHNTLGLTYIQAEDVTFLQGDEEFSSWNRVLDENLTLTWTYAKYLQVEVYAPDALGGAYLDTFYVLEGHTLSEVHADILARIRAEYYPNATDLPDADIILIKLTGEAVGNPEINAGTKITWRLAEYYNVEILYRNEGTGAWVSTIFVAREGSSFDASWSEYQKILALRDEIAGTAPEDYEYVWLVVDADGNVTDEIFAEHTAITENLRLTWGTRYNAEYYTLSIVNPADPTTVLWSADGLKHKTNVITYLSEQKYGDTDQSVWDWLQALVAANDPHLTDYVHEYVFSWRSYNAGGALSEIVLDGYTLEENLVLTWNYARVYENTTLGVIGAKPYTGDPTVDDYAILQDADGTWVIRFRDQWFADRATEFVMSADFLENAIAAGHGIRFDAKESEQEIVLSDALLSKLYAVAKTQGVDLSAVTLRYSPDEGKNVFDFAGGAEDVSGSVYFTLDFYVNGAENGQVLKLGDFATEHDPENDVYADVMITLPFANLVANGNGVKTFVCFEEETSNGKSYVKYELAAYDLDAMSVTFAAPHFSSVAINNQYRISTAMPHLIESGIPEDLLGKLPTNEDIAFYPIDLSVDEYYPAGAEVPIRTIVGKDDHLSKVNVTRTLVVNYGGEQVAVLPTSGTYTMPAHPINLRFEIAPKIYYVYYYVDGALMSGLTQSYTAYMIETAEAIEALKLRILSLEPLGEDYSAEDGWSWNGFDERSLGTADMYLSLVRSTTEESVTEKTVEVIFYGEDGVSVLKRVTYKASVLIDLSALPTVESIVGPDADSTRTAYWINLENGLRVPSDYTAEEWKALVDSGETISLRVAYIYRSFVIYTDGNVKVTIGDIEVNAAQRGAEVSVAISTKVSGKTPNLLIKTASGEILVKNAGEESVSFVMPAEDVIITVTYVAASTEFVDPDGEIQIGTIGELKSLPAIVIKRGMSIDLAKIPEGLVLVSAVVDGDTLVLTYQYTIGEGTDASAHLEALHAAIKPVEYKDRFIINGAIFENAEDALACVLGEIDFNEWSDTVDKNLHFGSFDQPTEEFPWIVILILGILLLLILLIALFYLLYIKGVLKPNFFLKAITAIVSAFFAVCAALAKAWLAIIRRFGIDEERLLRKYPVGKKRGHEATLDESVEALKQASEDAASRIASKTEAVMEELETSDDEPEVTVDEFEVEEDESSDDQEG